MTKQTFSTGGGKPASDQIAQRAYEIWEGAGRPDGHSAEHWFQAEAELSRRTIGAASASPNQPARVRNARQTPRLAAACN